MQRCADVIQDVKSRKRKTQLSAGASNRIRYGGIIRREKARRAKLWRLMWCVPLFLCGSRRLTLCFKMELRARARKYMRRGWAIDGNRNDACVGAKRCEREITSVLHTGCGLGVAKLQTWIVASSYTTAAACGLVFLILAFVPVSG